MIVQQYAVKVNRDTLYVLLNFLHLVAENSEDKKGPQVLLLKLHTYNFMKKVLK